MPKQTIEIKTKFCKVCKIGFKPSFALQMVCSNKCGNDYKNRTIKKHTTIKKVSDKMAVNLREYKKVRTEFLTLHPNCQANLKNCTKVATQIHHKKARIGSLLTDATHFLAVCHSCHHWIELHPLESKELNLSLERY